MTESKGDTFQSSPDDEPGRPVISRAEPRRYALRFALIYALFGGAWIVFSDSAVDWLFSNIASMATAQTIKGLLFIGATATMVYILALRTRIDAQRIRAERDREYAERQLEQMYSRVGEGIFFIDPNNRRILQCNEAGGEIFGYEPEELVGKSTRILHADDEAYDRFAEIAEPVLETGEIFHTAYRMRRSDGKLINTEVSVSPAHNDLPWQRGVITVVRDVTSRETALRALMKSETLFRRLLDAIPAAVSVCDRSGKIVLHNPAAERLWGRAPAPGDTYSGAYKAWTANGVELTAGSSFAKRTLLTGMASENVIIVIERPDGSQARALASTVPLFDKEGQVERVICCSLDVTREQDAKQARLAAEKRSKDASAYLQQLVKQIPDVVYIKNAELRYELTNDAYKDYVKYELENIIGLSDADIFPKSTAERIRRDDMDVIRRGRITTFEEQFQHRHDGMHTLLTTKVPLLDSEGNQQGLCGISRDVTQFKRLTEALQERVKEMRTLYEATTQLSDTSRTLDQRLAALVDVLPAGWMYPEITRVQIVFKDHVFETEGFEKTPWTLSTSIQRDGQTLGQVVVALTEERPDWDEGPFLSEERDLLDAIGRLIQNAADREDLEKQYLQAQKLESVGQLAGGIAHDFNNTLSIVLGYTKILMEEFGPSDPHYEDIREVYDAGQHATSLTRQLLAFSRQEIIETKMLDLGELISDTISMLQRLTPEDIEIRWRPAGTELLVEADPGQIQQILINMTANARDAIEGTGTITLEAGTATLDEAYCALHRNVQPGDYVELCISDTGRGMDSDTRDRIFEPFYTTKAPGKGTGLGLASVYGIIQQHHGAVNVYSEPDAGSTFRIYLPRVVQPGAARETEDAPDSAGAFEGTVLIVEDDERLLRLNARLISSLGHTVLEANSPQRALELARSYEDDIDLVVTDVVMPEMNGRELYEELERIRPDLRCLYVSGYTADIIAERGVLEEGVHYLSKPFTKSALSAKITEVMNAPRVP